MNPRLYRFRFIAFGLLVVLCVFIFSLLITTVAANSVPASDPTGTATFDSANAMTRNLNTALTAFEQRAGSTMNHLSRSLHAATSTAAVGRFMGRIGGAFGLGVHATNTFMISSLVTVVDLPGTVAGGIADSNLVASVIKPVVKAPVPVINPSQALAQALTTPVAITAVHPSIPSAPVPITSAQPSWPIHGAITTLFGVPELPYEAIHTGLDISDGNRPGVTPVHPYLPGKVIATIHSYAGLGNHVIIDHGGGVTSVYGHLNSIAVSVGQTVDQSTVVGYEGTTGASTGTHLHFEIRINGQPVNPLLYIPGRP